MRRAELYWESLSPAARLAIGYMAILMVISIIFSVVLYELAQSQIVDGLIRQYNRLNGPPHLRGEAPSIERIQTDLEIARQGLIIRLVYFNAVILVAGSALSYWLAKRTVRPIEEALQAQTQFTADASHELRTPLTVMQSEIEVARRDPKLGKKEAVALLDSNLEEVVKLRALADGLLQLARSDGSDYKLEPTGLRSVVSESVKRVESMAKAKNIKLKVEAAKDLKVQADPASLSQLFVLLIDNAIKYSPEKTTVTIEARKQGREAAVSVVDQGRGIAPEDQPLIFDRFYRADKARSSTDVSGHGLGLSIAKKIAEIHSAQISVVSAKGKGSTFTVKLPLS